MPVDPQALAYLVASALVLAGGRLFQIGTKQGRALRRAYRRIEAWEQYGLSLRRKIRVAGMDVPEYPENLKYMNPSGELEEDQA